MLYTNIPLTEYTAVMDARLHSHVSQEIADPAYRHKFYSIDGMHGSPDGSDMRVLCLGFIHKSTGNAKIRGVILVRDDPCVDMLGIAALRVIASQEFPMYATANMVMIYTVDGRETVVSMSAYLQEISTKLGIKIEALKNATGEVADQIAHRK
jgi:hypothetical protein